MSETIAAILSSPDDYGIVRVSGPASRDIMHCVMEAHKEDIAAEFRYMEAPDTYTGEDMLEIRCVGSSRESGCTTPERVLEAVLGTDLEGVRQAKPGEFTRRAFESGKMDLAQAEAVMDVINARSELARSIAEGQRAGRLSRTIRDIRTGIVDVLAQMDADPDFAYDFDGDEEDFEESGVVNDLRWVHTDIDDLLDTASIGRIAREGVRAVIIGKPKSGKTTLMNAFSDESRVTATDISGMTSGNEEQTRLAIASADVILLVLDGSTGFDSEDARVIEYIKHIDSRRIVTVITKEDLGVSVSEERIREQMPESTVIVTSLIDGGAADAVRKISDAVTDILELGTVDASEMNIVSTPRHIHLLRKASAGIDEAIDMVQNGDPMDEAEIPVHDAYDRLGSILGEDVSDEKLDKIFGSFCMGL